VPMPATALEAAGEEDEFEAVPLRAAVGA